MALAINSNFAALSSSALASMKTHQSAMGTSISRISAGTKLVTAKDGAADFVAAKRLQSDADGYNTLYNNVQRGASMINVADKSVSTILDTLRSMREVSLEYDTIKNDTGDTATAQKAALKNQFDALNSSLDALTSVKYNGKNLLSEAQDLNFAVGLSAGDAPDTKFYLNLADPSNNKIVDADGNNVGSVEAVTSGKITKVKLTFDGEEKEYDVDSDKKLKINGVELGTASANAVAATGTDKIKFELKKQLVEKEYTFDNEQGKFLDENEADSGFSVERTETETTHLNGGIKYITINSTKYELKSNKLYAKGAGDDYDVELKGSSYDASTGVLKVPVAENIDTSTAAPNYNVQWGSIKGYLSSLSVTNPSGILTAIDNVSKEEAKIGGALSAMDYIASSLQDITAAQREGYETIADVDIATEMTSYVKNNIYSQAAQAMISQANQSLAQVLNLLQ